MTLSANIQIDGLQPLRERMHESPATFNAAMKPAVSESAGALRDEMRVRAVGNILPNSVRFKTLNGGLSAIVGSVALTAASIEHGRKVGEVVEAEKLASWASRKGLTGRTLSILSHRINKVSRSQRDSESRAARDLGWIIAAQIKERGTEPRPFILPALPARLPQIRSFFVIAVSNALRTIARG